jgi:hypothetical protein
MRLQGTNLIAACLLACLVWLTPAAAQEQSEPPTEPDPTAQAADEAPAEPDPTETESEKEKHFGLYVYAGVGTSDLKSPINSTMVTSASQRSDNYIDLDSNNYGRAAIGWQLDNKKGDFRLEWVGISEDSYTARFDGRAAQLPTNLGLSNINVLNNLPWWLITIDGGQMSVVRNPPQWSLNQDANGNQAVDLDEVTYGDPNFVNVLTVPDNLQNRVHFADMLYGREWGGRRFSGRWWAGLRYSIYDGNIRAGAWLNSTRPGEGYTDGSLLRVLNFRQEYTGFGPVGAMEANFNFFEKRLQLYLKGQVAFQLGKLNADSGTFFTFVVTQTPPILTVPVATDISAERDKSTWQTNAEAGVRWNMKSGIQLDLAYQIQGFLDVVLLPSQIQIPDTPGQAAGGVSAVYNSSDLVYKTARFGVGFQF